MGAGSPVRIEVRLAHDEEAGPLSDKTDSKSTSEQVADEAQFHIVIHDVYGPPTFRRTF